MNDSMKTRRQMSLEYGVTEKTFRRYLKKYNITLPSGNIPPKFQEIIYSKLGTPRPS